MYISMYIYIYALLERRHTQAMSSSTWITADTITTQEKSAANVEQVHIEKERRLEPESPLKPAEKSEFRSLIGSFFVLACTADEDGH